MTIETRYVLMVSMDVDPAYEELFNEVYDTEHVPYLLEVPGVHAVSRIKGIPAHFAMAGETRAIPAPSPVYTAIYEIDDPAVLTGDDWGRAVETGRWSTEVRPHTTNRHHAVYERTLAAEKEA